MKNKNHIFFTLFINFLGGLAVALMSALLIYFKQKAILHHVIVLLTVISLYSVGYFMSKWIKNISDILKILSLLSIILLCWLGPQFIYQFRPYTFYFSGFAILCILILIISTLLLSTKQSIQKPWILSAFLIGYGIGYLLSANVVYYLIIGLSVICIGYYLFANQLNLIYKSTVLTTVILSVVVFWSFSTPMLFFDDQPTYEDKVVFNAKTQYHDLVITQWHHDYWYFIDQLKNLSSIDEYLYYEPMVHSVFEIPSKSGDVLVLGGENGCLIREVLKYDHINRVDVISYDTLLRNLGMENPYFTQINLNAFKNEKVHIIHEDLLQFISAKEQKYDLIFIDLPDPRSLESNQYYTREFYQLINKHLNDQGVMITQAGSPYFATEAFFVIGNTIQSVGFNTLAIHNQILTLGEWGWYICSKELSEEKLKERLQSPNAISVQTRWYNQDAARLISSFGKSTEPAQEFSINTLENPLVYKYYLKGNWDLN